MVDRAALRREFERAYRLLPRPFADEAVRTSMQRLRLALGRPTPTLKWADFGAGGRFLRGGGASVADYAAQRIGRAQEDPDVAALSAAVDEHGAQPGRMIMDAAGERFFWFVPVTTLGADPAQPAAVTRGFVVDLGLFAELAHHFNAGAGLTPAEMRVLFQLTAGAAPREAAALDGVSLETKRAQLKSAAAKLQCGGQTDLVRLMLGQMTHLLSMADSEAGQTALAERWVARHLPPDMRLRSARLEDGRVLRCIECGAPDGAPVVAVHGMMFGMLLRKAGPHLRRHGVRLLTPLRPGFLDARPALGAVAGSDLTDAAVAEIRAAIDVLVGGPVKLLGHSLGALTARVVASRHPGAVSTLVMLSANLPQSPSAPDSGAGSSMAATPGWSAWARSRGWSPASTGASTPIPRRAV